MKALELFRREKGVSRAWLAREIGVSYTTLWRFERVKDAKPPKSVLFLAAHLLSVSPDDLRDEAQ